MNSLRFCVQAWTPFRGTGSRLVATALLVCLTTTIATGQTPEPGGAKDIADESVEPQLSVAELSEIISRSLVMVQATGRDGRVQGHGTGFVISQDGLIATARHVVGDRRMVRVELPDGSVVPVTHIHAATEAVDMVVLKVDANNLSPLLLNADSEPKTGQAVVTMGHPHELKHSTFSGIVSGFKEIEGINMLQLAMTIEPGSSGEPVIDRQGRVIGLVTLKSQEVPNLGFAIPVKHLKVLLEDPTPVPMSRWMTIGALDPKRWETLFGANWSQRAGRMLVNGQGESFGGRSLCLQRAEPPSIPFEVQVDVKLDDERGAAGLTFHADGDDKHYGFYPSNGNIRLTRFNGPDVGSWTILHNEPHPAYRSGDWNTFKVRVEEGRMLCYLNDHLVVTSADDRIPSGRTGLATFRGTAAEFRRFQTGAKLPPLRPDANESAAIADILTAVTDSRPAPNDVVQRLQPFGQYASRILQEQAEQLERRAKQIRQLATDVHAATVRSRILNALGKQTDVKAGDEKPAPDLLKAALLIGVLDNEEIDPEMYVDRVSQLADEIRETLPPDAGESDRLKALDHMLFEEYGFRGSRYDYYTRSNSYLNEVIDDREGLPITLCVLYIELARRLDLKVVGLGLPGHYVVRFEPSEADAKPEIIDVFNHGKRLSDDDARALIRSRGFPIRPEFFEGQSAETITQRMLVNLLGLAEDRRDDGRVLRYLEVLVAMDSKSPEFRAKRLEMRARSGRLTEAIEDADWFINSEETDFDKDRLYEFRAQLERQRDEQK